MKKAIKKVTLESLAGKVDTLATSVKTLAENMAKGFKQVDEHFKEVDENFRGVSRHFKQVDERFKGIDKQFKGIDKSFEQLEQKLIKKIDDKIDALAISTAKGFAATATKEDLRVVTDQLAGFENRLAEVELISR